MSDKFVARERIYNESDSFVDKIIIELRDNLADKKKVLVSKNKYLKLCNMEKHEVDEVVFELMKVKLTETYTDDEIRDNIDVVFDIEQRGEFIFARIKR